MQIDLTWMQVLLRNICEFIFIENKKETSIGALLGSILFMVHQTFHSWLQQHNTVVSFEWVTWYWALILGVAIVKIVRWPFTSKLDPKTREMLQIIKEAKKAGNLTKSQIQEMTLKLLEERLKALNAAETETPTLPEATAIPATVGSSHTVGTSSSIKKPTTQGAKRKKKAKS